MDDKKILVELYNTTKFSAYDFKNIILPTHWTNSYLDLSPINLPPIDNSFADLKQYGQVTGRLIMDPKIKNLAYQPIFEINPDEKKLEMITDEMLQEDILFKFYQKNKTIPSKILVCDLGFTSKHNTKVSLATHPAQELTGQIYYK